MLNGKNLVVKTDRASFREAFAVIREQRSANPQEIVEEVLCKLFFIN